MCATYYTIWYNHEVIYFSFSFIYLFLCGWRKVLYATESLWCSKDNWQELVLSFHYVSLKNGQVIRPPSKLFDQPRYPPTYLFMLMTIWIIYKILMAILVQTS